MATTHATHIEFLPHMGRWIVHCDQCGNVGVGQDYEADAVAIADRHAEVGGFEHGCTSLVCNPIPRAGG